MRSKVKHIIIAFLVILLMGIATKYDLKINIKLNNPDSIWASIFEVIGELPIYIGLVFSSIVLFQSSSKYKNLCLASNFFTIFLLVFMPSRYFVSLNILNISIILLVSLMLFFGLIKLSYKISKETYNKMKYVALICGIGIICELLIITIMKACWSRVRFYELSEDYSEYSPWYVINWFAGSHTSFPSGHTAGATNILYFTLVPSLLSNKKYKDVLIKFFAYSFIVATALSRIVLGRHYLSDVVMAFAITYLIHNILVYVLKHRQLKFKSI